MIGRIMQYSESDIKKRYRIHAAAGAVRLGQLSALPVVLVVLCFIYLDLSSSFARVPLFLILLRVYCAAAALLMFFSSVLFKEKIRLNKCIHYIYATSFLIMTAPRIGVFAGTGHFDRTVYTVVLSVFVTFFVLAGGSRKQLSVYLFSLLLMAASLLYYGKLSAYWFHLSNPVALMIACTFIAHVQERLRFREFRSGLLVEYKNSQIKESSDVIESINRRLMADMVLAREIQYSLIPVAPPPVAGLKVSGMYLPVDAIGGDFYDYISLDDGKSLGIFVGDVSGHGMPAALITAMVKTLINTAGDLKYSPSALLSYINRTLVEQVRGNFFTAFYGIYDSETRRFVYARAGHSYPFLVREGQVTELKGKGTMLGISIDAVFDSVAVDLLPGDRILFYTDGLIEAENDEGEMFEGRLISDILPSLSFLPADVMVNTLFSRLLQFHGITDFEDDICIICAEVLLAEQEGC